MISKGNNPIEEVDIRKLPYLQAIVKETLRLHQPVPFLLPPKAGKDMDIGGYTISKDAKVLKSKEISQRITIPYHERFINTPKPRFLSQNSMSTGIKMFSTSNKKPWFQLRANAILAVSLVVYKAAAALKKIPWLRKVVVEGHLGRTVTHKLQLHPRLSR
ncbi:hypothetical protein JHK85_034744 [Glycine max]|nr:hypothetical protein JHK85_034744 [Glycine max]